MVNSEDRLPEQLAHTDKKSHEAVEPLDNQSSGSSSTSKVNAGMMHDHMREMVARMRGSSSGFSSGSSSDQAKDPDGDGDNDRPHEFKGQRPDVDPEAESSSADPQQIVDGFVRNAVRDFDQNRLMLVVRVDNVDKPFIATPDTVVKFADNTDGSYERLRRNLTIRFSQNEQHILKEVRIVGGVFEGVVLNVKKENNEEIIEAIEDQALVPTPKPRPQVPPSDRHAGPETLKESTNSKKKVNSFD